MATYKTAQNKKKIKRKMNFGAKVFIFFCTFARISFFFPFALPKTTKHPIQGKNRKKVHSQVSLYNTRTLVFFFVVA